MLIALAAALSVAAVAGGAAWAARREYGDSTCPAWQEREGWDR